MTCSHHDIAIKFFSWCHSLTHSLTSDLRQVGGFSGSSTNKIDRHDNDITEILLKVALSTTKQTNKQINKNI
jgi:hypothetical protein